MKSGILAVFSLILIDMEMMSSNFEENWVMFKGSTISKLLTFYLFIFIEYWLKNSIWYFPNNFSVQSIKQNIKSW